MSEAYSQQTALKTRGMLRITSFWECANPRDKEERRKEEVLRVCRELAKDSRLGERVPEYSPCEARRRPYGWVLSKVRRESAAHASP